MMPDETNIFMGSTMTRALQTESFVTRILTRDLLTSVNLLVIRADEYGGANIATSLSLCSG